MSRTSIARVHRAVAATLLIIADEAETGAEIAEEIVGAAAGQAAVVAVDVADAAVAAVDATAAAAMAVTAVVVVVGGTESSATHLRGFTRIGQQ